MSNLLPSLNVLPSETRAKSVALLNQTLADLSDLYSQAKQAHWNVRGANFFSLHKLFDEVAGSIEEFIDEVAERVVALGGVAEGTVRQAAARSRLPEFPTNGKNGPAYVHALAMHFAACAKSVRAGAGEADDAGDTGTVDLLSGIAGALEKSLWFLEAHSRE